MSPLSAHLDTIPAGLPEAPPAVSTWTRPDGGMFLRVRPAQSYDTTAPLPQAVWHDAAHVPGAPFHSAAPAPDRSTLRLCFVTPTPEETREGLRRLGEGLAAG